MTGTDTTNTTDILSRCEVTGTDTTNTTDILSRCEVTGTDTTNTLLTHERTAVSREGEYIYIYHGNENIYIYI